MSRRKSGFLTGLFIGGLTGAIMGVLYAPRPGDETRKKLTERGEEAAAGMKSVALRAAGSGEDIIGNIKSILSDATGLVSDTLRALRKEIREETEELRQMVFEERQARNKKRIVEDYDTFGRCDCSLDEEDREPKGGGSRKDPFDDYRSIENPDDTEED